jgi:hypothetical protein
VSERKQQEALIDRGSWVSDLNLYRLTTSDGIIRDNVTAGTHRLWVYFYSKHNANYETQRTIQWRMRRA